MSARTTLLPETRRPSLRSAALTDQRFWHTLEATAVLDRLGTTEQGLPGDEANRRLLAHGPNELGVARRVSPWSLLLGQFRVDGSAG